MFTLKGKVFGYNLSSHSFFSHSFFSHSFFSHSFFSHSFFSHSLLALAIIPFLSYTPIPFTTTKINLLKGLFI